MADNVIAFKRPPKAKNPPPARTVAKKPGRWPPTTIVFLILVVGYLGGGAFGAWSPAITARHLAAGLGCSMARVVGMGGAHIGEPGYWRHLDPARTGVSCAVDPGRKGDAETKDGENSR